MQAWLSSDLKVLTFPHRSTLLSLFPTVFCYRPYLTNKYLAKTDILFFFSSFQPLGTIENFLEDHMGMGQCNYICVAGLLLHQLIFPEKMMHVQQRMKQLGLQMVFVFLIVWFQDLMCLESSYNENWYRTYVYTPVFDNIADKRKAAIANYRLSTNVEKVPAFGCFYICKWYFWQWKL